MLIRPVNMADLEALLELAEESGPGMTNFTINRTSMIEKIDNSIASFKKTLEKPGDEFYFLVLEDTRNGRLVGCCSIFATVGVTRPFYSFRVLNLTHSSIELQHYEPVQVLQMVEEHRGNAEIASLFLTKDYRKDGNGKLLSRSRFLFMAQFRQRFPEFVIAEMRGAVDKEGLSAFWNALGDHFFPMNFIEADQFNALGHFQFIADMMPKSPVYIRLLPQQAQAMIGKTHQLTRPALAMLEKEGFRNDGCVDVFDAGPIIKCPTDDIRTISNSREAIISEVKPLSNASIFITANTHEQNFRLSRGQMKLTDQDTLIVDASLAQRLGVTKGDRLRFSDF